VRLRHERGEPSRDVRRRDAGACSCQRSSQRVGHVVVAQQPELGPGQQRLITQHQLAGRPIEPRIAALLQAPVALLSRGAPR
jgi:hypothetical protein